MSGQDLTTTVTRFIQENLRPDGMTEPITETSPLLALGVLDSLHTAMLLNFIRAEFGVAVPPLAIEFENFKDPRSIAALVGRLLAESTGGG